MKINPISAAIKIGGLVGFATLYAMGLLGALLFKKEALGGGDIKLYAIVGLVLGIAPMFLSIFVAALIGLIFILGFIKIRIIRWHLVHF